MYMYNYFHCKTSPVWSRFGNMLATGHTLLPKHKKTYWIFWLHTLRASLCIAQNTDNVIFVIEKNIMYCKWRDGENSISMSGSHLCFPRNETVQPPYVKNSIIMFCLTIPTLIYLWEIYIFPRLVCPQYFAAAKYVEYINLSQTHECGNWDWGRAIPKKGIHKWDFRCSAANF